MRFDFSPHNNLTKLEQEMIKSRKHTQDIEAIKFVQ